MGSRSPIKGHAIFLIESFIAMDRFYVCVLFLFSAVAIGHCGNFRPYGVSVTGFQGAGTTGHDISANGYAGA